jgi:PAS domain S-box-containing protein
MTTSTDTHPGRRATQILILVFVFLGTGIVAGGYLYYRNYERHYRARVESELSAIADLKVAVVSQYRKERLGDAEILFRNAAFAALVRRVLYKPGDVGAQRELKVWIGKYEAYAQYDRAFLLDTHGVARMWSLGGAEPVAAIISQRVSEVLRSDQVTFQDFYRDEHNQRVYLATLTPVIDEQDGGRPLGVLVLRMDAKTYLYPFINRWPVPSQTAETLLVRRDGNDAVFLNDPRFKTNAFNLRIPLTTAGHPAVKAALGQEGIVEGTDYHAVPVVACVRAVPNSPWFLVASMHVSEVSAPMRKRLWEVVELVGVLLLGTGIIVGFLWRQQNMRYYRERYQAADALYASEVRYRRLFEAARDGILILDAETGVIVDVNPFLIELLGFPREVFVGKRLWELGLFTDIVGNRDNFLELQQKGYARYGDMPLETSDGRRVEVEFVSNVYLAGEKNVIQCDIRDITERKRAEETLREGKERYQLLIECLGEGIVSVSRQGLVLMANPAAENILGLPRGGAIGKDLGEFVDPGDMPLMAGEAERGVRGEKRTFELRVTRPNREKRTLQVTATPQYDASGLFQSSMAVIRDITEEKVLLQRLRLLAHTLDSRGRVCIDLRSRQSAVVRQPRVFAHIRVRRMQSDWGEYQHCAVAIEFAGGQCGHPSRQPGRRLVRRTMEPQERWHGLSDHAECGGGHRRKWKGRSHSGCGSGYHRAQVGGGGTDQSKGTRRECESRQERIPYRDEP